MTEKPDIPDFKSEAEEAEWWYNHRDWLESEFERAGAQGRLRRGSTALRKATDRARQRELTVRLSEDDFARIHDLAVRRGQDDEGFAGALLHEALTQKLK